MYPDIVAGIQKEIHAKDAILEGEAIGFDPQSESFLPFQETVQRKRKYGIDEKAKEIPLKLFAFELLYADGKSFIDSPFTERRKKLEQVVKNKGELVDDTVIVAHNEISDDPKRIELIFEENITKGLEGIIAKKLDGTYQPGARGWNWIKFKRSYSSKIEDTIDCLVMGYDYGKGKRASFGIGAFLVGVYDQKEDRYLTVAKIGTGLKDNDWISLKEKAEKITIKKLPVQYEVDKLMDCDVWVSPEVVVEIKADEITRSPVHTAGRVMKATKSGNAMEVEVAGFALRFPRLVRFREDKTPEEVTTVKEVNEMFKAQKV
jgi:DNA ligase-1